LEQLDILNLTYLVPVYLWNMTYLVPVYLWNRVLKFYLTYCKNESIVKRLTKRGVNYGIRKLKTT